MSNSPLNLQQLALEKSSRSQTLATKRPRHWVSRYVIPLGILVGFVTIFGTSIAKQLLPRKMVTVTPVIAKRGSVTSSGSVLFQAAGWVEPRPSAVKVTALAGGVVDELFVVEGQEIKKGEPVARLIVRDAELQVEQAEATLEIANGEVQRALAEKTAAAARLNNPTHRRAELADAKSLLARANAELARLPSLIQAGEAKEKFARLSLEGKSTAGTAVAGIALEKSRRDSTTAGAELSDLESRRPHLEDEVASLQSRVKALEEQLRLLIDEQRALDEAAARLVSAEASRHLAMVEVDRAKLNLERTTIRAPFSGRVLRVVASPGSRVIGLDESTGQNTAIVIEMYDPNRLQIRADVRLEDVPMVEPGAPVEIETASSGTKLQGRVLQSTSSANVQKNTLEVKVELLNPPRTVSPEMLVKATFLAPLSPEQSQEFTESQRLFVPTQVIQSGADGSMVWVSTPEGTAVRKSISVGAETDDGLTEVIDGLVITDKLIASGTDGLQPGDLIKTQGDDHFVRLKR
jgi:HlyD family secretion protein